MWDGLLDSAATADLPQALAVFPTDSVHAALGRDGGSALARWDPAGVERALRAAADPQIATLVRLFLFGRAVPEADAQAALHDEPVEPAS